MVTQVLFGAAVGQAVGGRRLGRRAVWLGALGGLLPDLDILLAAGDGGFAEMRYHRGFTHALWFGPVVGAALGYAAWRLSERRLAQSGEADDGMHPGSRAALGDWVRVGILAVFTHPLLDICTSYGTQLLAPFSDHRFAYDAVGIIDLFYTLVIALALVLGALRPHRLRFGRNAALAALVVTTGYLFYGLQLNREARLEAERQLAAAGVRGAEVHAYPTVFQPYLRRLVARTHDAVYVGHVSTWQPGPIDWHRIPVTESPLIDAVRATERGRVFEWFAMGRTLGSVRRGEEGGYVVEIDDMRYGFPTRPARGIWGVRARLDGSGRLLGPVERFRVERPEPSWALVRDLFRASFGLAEPGAVLGGRAAD